MCTLTLFREEEARTYRIVMNRDENRQRPRALPPILVREKSIVALHPVDLPSRGTWIAVNELGLSLCLLNAHPTPTGSTPALTPTVPFRSRGELIPGLIFHATALDALKDLIARDLGAYPPFRMLAVDEQQTCLLTSVHGTPPTVRVFATLPQMMLASSGLGDELVTPPREKLFKEMLSNESCDPASLQDAYHAHVWPGQENISVMMSREEARTVSKTTVLVQRGTISLHYQEIPERADSQVSLHKPLLITRTPRTHSARSTVYS